jgi:uncharacterized membrane protein
MMTTAKRNWLIGALVVSLALNLAVAGFVGSKWLTRGIYGGGSSISGFNRRAAFATLDEDQHKQIRSLWKSERKNFRSDFKTMRKTRRELRDLLSAAELDETAIAKTFDMLALQNEKIHTALQDIFLKVAKTLPPEDRQKFFTEGMKRKKRGARKKKNVETPTTQ